MADKEYVCGYTHCLHDGEKVKSSEAVVIGKKHFHWDCAEKKQEITDCVNSYMDCIEDKTQYPIATRIINTLVFKHQVPTAFIQKNIQHSGLYYKDKPTYILYGLRKMFWEKEFIVK